MRQATQTYHVLEIRRRPDASWQICNAGMFNPAIKLVHHGHLSEGIEKAGDIYVDEFGNMNGVSFRCLTTTKTVTVCGGPFEDAIFES